MTPEQFTYWLQGFSELNPEQPTQQQWQSIREHLATVFVKVTPVVRTEHTLSLFPKPRDIYRKLEDPLPDMGTVTYC